MTARELKTTDIELATRLGHTVSSLLSGAADHTTHAADDARRLVQKLAAVAMGLLTPPEPVKAAAVKEFVMGAGDTAQIHGNGDVVLTRDDGPLAAYTGHASDCSTNNRGVPGLVVDCDCGAGLTLQSYFKDNLARGVTDFSLRSCLLPGGEVGFYLHPARVDGHTPQFTVKGNILTTHTPA